jgi:hypothetical protein
LQHNDLEHHFDEVLFSLIELVYEAALEPVRWLDFLESIRVVTHCCSANIVYHNLSSFEANVEFCCQWSPDTISVYNEYYAERNVALLHREWVAETPYRLREPFPFWVSVI